MSRWMGAILVLVSAAAFGLMPLFRSWAAGVSVPVLLALRFGIAAAVLAGTCVARKEPWPRRRTIVVLLAMGALGYFGESFSYFAALSYAPSGMVSLLLYTYPAVVTVLSVAVLRERVGGAKLLALGLAIAGLALTVIPGLRGSGGKQVQALGVVLGLACSASYALYIIVGSKLPNDARALPSSVLVCAGACVMFAAVAAARFAQSHESLPQNGRAWAGIAALGIVCTVIGVSAFLAGLARIGPVRASTISVFEPVVTGAVGVLALGERFGPVQVLGGALIIAGAVLSARGPKARKQAGEACATSSPPPARADTAAATPQDQREQPTR